MSSFIKNVGYASAGIKYFFSNERNGKIQGIITVIIIGLGFFVGISRIDWCIILICIALVLSLEMINTSLERVCEMISPDYHPMIKIIKDVAAGAVFWSAIISAIIGAIVFYPYLLK